MNKNLFACFLFLASIILNCCQTETKLAPPIEVKANCEEEDQRCTDGTHIESCKTGEWKEMSQCEINARCDIADFSEQNIACHEIGHQDFSKYQLVNYKGKLKEAISKEIFQPDWPTCLHFRQTYKEIAEGKKNKQHRISLKTNIGIDRSNLHGLTRCILWQFIEELKGLSKQYPEFADIADADIKIVEHEKLFLYNLKFVSANTVGRALKLEIVLSNDFGKLNTLSSKISSNIIRDLSLAIGLKFSTGGTPNSQRSNQAVAQIAENIAKAMKHFYLKQKFASSLLYCQNETFIKFLQNEFSGMKSSGKLLQCKNECRKNIEQVAKEISAFNTEIRKNAKQAVVMNTEQISTFKNAREYLLCHTLMEQLSEVGRIPDEEDNFSPLLPSMRLGTDNMLSILHQILGDEPYATILFKIIERNTKGFQIFVSGFQKADKDALNSLMLKSAKKRLDSPAVLELLPYWVRKDANRAVPYILEGINDRRISSQNLQKLQSILAEGLTTKAAEYLLVKLEAGKISPIALTKLLNHPDYQQATISMLETSLLKLEAKAAIAVLEFVQQKMFQEKRKQPLSLTNSIKVIDRQSKNFEVYYKVREILQQKQDINWRWPSRPAEVHFYVRSSKDQEQKQDLFTPAIQSIKGCSEDLAIEIFNYARILPEENLRKMSKLLKEAGTTEANIISVAKRIVKMDDSPKAMKLAKEILHQK